MTPRLALPGRCTRAASLLLLVALTRGMPPFSVGFDDHPRHPRDPAALPSYLEDEIEFAVKHGKETKAPALREQRK